MRKVKFIENGSEITAGTRGASLGVASMKVAANKKQNSFFKYLDYTVVNNENHLLMDPVKHPNAIRVEGLTKVFDYVGDVVRDTVKNGEFAFVLAGDHGSAGGTIAGIKAAFPNKRLGVLWIDAHGDLHSPYTSPSGNMHGMPLATALAMDNLESKVNDISDEEARLWGDLKNKYGIAPKINPEDLVFVSVRDTEKPENELMARNNIKNYEVDEVREKGVGQVIVEIDERLKDCDMIYVSFDVDSMDPSISIGTGTPVPHGLWKEEALELLKSFAVHKKTVCMEFVEINPCLDDKGNVMAETAFEILEEVSAALKEE